MSSFLVCCGAYSKNQISSLRNHMPVKRLFDGHLAEQLIGAHLSNSNSNSNSNSDNNSNNDSKDWHHYDSEKLSITLSGSDSGISERSGIILAFEGYVTHLPLKGEALRIALIDDFIADSACIKSWQGSFRVAIHHQGMTQVFTDQLANRRLFYVTNEQGFVYSSHATPLLKTLPNPTLDGANVLQFLINGRFFSDGSPFKELKQIPSGIGHNISGNKPSLTTFTLFEYKLNATPSTKKSAQKSAKEELLPEFKQLLNNAIITDFEKAANPALILSGGYDSRYILNTLAELLPREKLDTISAFLWCTDIDKEDSDAVWAKNEAARHKVPFKFYPMYIPSAASFELMFELQSGMTATVFSHISDTMCCATLAQNGKSSILRGDEIFGPNGQTLSTREQALTKVSLGDLPFGEQSWADWLFDNAFTATASEISDWKAQRKQHIDNLAQVADEPNDLRDTLYCTERLPAFNSHLTSHRAPFVEHFNPLLDISLVAFNRQLPKELRTDKTLFRQCFLHYYPTHGFASINNAFQWNDCWQDKSLANFIYTQLKQLPAPFNANFWSNIGKQLIEHDQGNETQLKALQLAIRAMILGHWINYQ